jgi:predicted RNase H-like nuclease (RuvC/YqgF family)
MKPVITGIDPGATTAYAVLDIDGNILSTGSSKELSISAVINEVYKTGKPFAAGCDKKTAPHLLKEFSAKTGAKIISPPEDLTVEEKTALANIRTRNSHEMDALASARYAFNTLRGTIEKAKLFSSKEGAEIDKILPLAVKEGINFTEAKAKLEKKEVIIIKQKTRQEDNTHKIIARMHLLGEQNNELKSRIAHLERAIQELSDRKIRRSRPNAKYDLQKLANTINEKEKEITMLKNKICLLEEFLCERENIVARKFSHLNNISTEDSIIIVENPQNFSGREAEKLKETLNYIISDKTAKIPFTIIKKEGLAIKETDKFALINRKELEKRAGKSEMLFRIVDEYKKSRDK